MTMSDVERLRSVSDESLRFFGSMSASVSHEIRNKLAVINEKAGLVEDIAAAMKIGRVADPDRLETQARKIVEQIREANRVVRALNRLAHSTDEIRTTVDLSELAALIVELYGRKAAMAQAEIEHEGPSTGVSVSTSPFLAANAIGRCLDVALAHPGSEAKLTVTVEASDRGGVVRVDGLVQSDDWSAELAPDGCSFGALLETIDAGIAPMPNRGEIVLSIGHSKPEMSGSQT